MYMYTIYAIVFIYFQITLPVQHQGTGDILHQLCSVREVDAVRDRVHHTDVQGPGEWRRQQLLQGSS